MGNIDDDYVKEISAAYWEEEAEMKARIHSSQIKERLQKELYAKGIYRKITFMNYLDIENHIMLVTKSSVESV